MRRRDEPILETTPRARVERTPIGDADRLMASTGDAAGLARATLGSAAVAGAVLLFAWLPAEYGYDPTGVGGLLGLTPMGEIKQQLYAEAAAEDAAAASVGEPAPSAVATDAAALSLRLEAIEARLDRIAAALEAGASARETPAPAAVAPEPAAIETPPPAAEWRDSVSYTLAPGEGVEVKLLMDEGAVAEFEWSANGAVVNYDTHGDGGGRKISYEQGRGVGEQNGKLVAAFTGAHGWFWRNRTDGPVTVSLRARGDYSELRRPPTP